MKTNLAVGDHVRVTSGIYEGAQGTVDDLQPECSVMRIETTEGVAYSLIDEVQKVIQKQLPSNTSKKPLRR